MLEPHPQHTSKLAIRTAVAVFFTICGGNAPNPDISLQSDVLCWLILLLLIVATRGSDSTTELAGGYNDRKRYRIPTSATLWGVAACVAISLWYTAYHGSLTIYPLLIPFLLKFATKPHQTYTISDTKNQTTAVSPYNNVIISTSIGLFQILVLSNGVIHTHWLAIPIVAALFFTYVAFLHGSNQSSSRIPGVSFEKDGVGLAWRVVAVLLSGVGLHAVLTGNTPSFDVWNVPYGWFKAISWYYIALVADQTSWVIAPAITTLSLMISHDLVLESSMLSHFSRLFAAATAFGQVQHVLYTHTKHKAMLWCLALGSILVTANLVMLSRAQSLIAFPYSNHPTQHPIEILVERARIGRAAKLEKQSHSYVSAREEYRRRYNIEPPPGFQKWYEYTVEHQSVMIDDYDTIMNGIAPFLNFSGSEVVRVMDDASKTPDIELWNCAFTSSSGELNCTHPTRSNDRHISSSLGQVLEGLQGILPDVRFLVNHLDEPRVLSSKSVTHDRFEMGDSLSIVDLAHQSTWETISRGCTDNTPQDVTETRLVAGFADTLVNKSSSAGDLCRHSEYHNMHGMLTSPTSFKLIKELVPVLSTGSLSTMNDILFPSPAYSEEQFKYHQSQDMPWASKKNEMFWTGSTTGGYVGDKMAWTSFHRQRFVALTQTFTIWATGRLAQLSTIDDDYRRSAFDRLVSYIINKKLFNVAFTKIFQCNPQACADQRSAFTLSSTSSASRIYKSRLTFDLDGNGISGRFYSLLASHSLPLKQTILREWHDDRLVPWVHYIPISLGMEELQEVVWYFTIDKRGKELAREIAEEGRVWFGKTMREVDRGVYVYRLMLELARLQDPSRGRLAR